MEAAFTHDNSLLEELNEFSVTPVGENFQKVVPSFLQTLSRVPFHITYPVCFVVLFFAAVSHSLEYSYVLNSLSLPSESLNLRWP